MSYNTSMPINIIKRDIKRHRPIDWFAIFVLISLTFVVGSIIADKTEQFIKDMDWEAKRLNAHMQSLQLQKDLRDQ